MYTGARKSSYDRGVILGAALLRAATQTCRPRYSVGFLFPCSDMYDVEPFACVHETTVFDRGGRVPRAKKGFPRIRAEIVSPWNPWPGMNVVCLRVMFLRANASTTRGKRNKRQHLTLRNQKQFSKISHDRTRTGS